ASALDRPAGCTLTISFGDLGGGHLDIVSRKGKVVCTSLPAPDGGRRPDYAGADWLARALAGRRLDAPVLDTATGERVALVSAPLAGRRGVVAGFVELAPLARSLARLQGGGSSLAFLVASADGKTVLARSVEPDRSIGAALAGTGFARSRPSGEWRDLDGTKRIYSSAAIPSTGWRLYVGEESGAALAAAVRLERRELGIIAAGLAAFLLATWVIYRRTARPIKELAAGVRSASSEAGSESAPVRGHGPAEVRALAEDVNGLLATVRSELAERRRVEEDLRVSEESYRLLFEKHPAPMWLFDPETLRFLAINDAAVAAYGYSKEEFLALTLDDIRPEQDRGVLRREPPDLGRRDEGSLWRHRKKDGTVIEVMVVADTVEFEGRPVRVVLAQDVTEQRRLGEQLRPPPAGPGRRPEGGARADRRRGGACGGADPTAARVQPPAGAEARPDPGERRGGGDAEAPQPRDRREHRDRVRARAGPRPGLHRPRPARAGDPEPGGERARRDAGRRQALDPDVERRDRPALRGRARRRRARPARAAPGDRQRRRDGRGDARARLRPLLHDQAARDRLRALDRVRDREAERRTHLALHGAGHRNDLQAVLPAGDGGGGARGGAASALRRGVAAGKRDCPPRGGRRRGARARGRRAAVARLPGPGGADARRGDRRGREPRARRRHAHGRRASGDERRRAGRAGARAPAGAPAPLHVRLPRRHPRPRAGRGRARRVHREALPPRGARARAPRGARRRRR